MPEGSTRIIYFIVSVCIAVAWLRQLDVQFPEIQFIIKPSLLVSLKVCECVHCGVVSPHHITSSSSNSGNCANIDTNNLQRNTEWVVSTALAYIITLQTKPFQAYLHQIHSCALSTRCKMILHQLLPLLLLLMRPTIPTITYNTWRL